MRRLSVYLGVSYVRGHSCKYQMYMHHCVQLSGNLRSYFTVFQLLILYLRHGLLHLRMSEGGECCFQIVHDALKAVTLHYLPLMAAQQTEGHFKDHPGPLDKHKI